MNEQPKILAIDYGTRYVGLATNDETNMLAVALPHIEVRKTDSPLYAVQSFLEQGHYDQLVIGMPWGMDMKPTQKSREVEQFAEALTTNIKIPFRLWNETYTSQQAAKSPYRNRNISIHSESARIILQTYLDFLHTGV